MRKLFAYFISIYQNKLSPLKGFNCAHSGLHGGDSCSEFTKKQILQHGVFASISAIKHRFGECRDAAHTIQQRPPLSQRGDCDCGLSACDISGFDSCGGSSGGSSSGSGSCLTDLIGYGPKQLLLVIAIIVLVLFVSYYYFIGRQVESVNIRLNNGIEETSDGGMLSTLFRSQKPDYRINFYLKDGAATTNVLRNASAKEWLNLKARGSFYLNDVTKMVILNQEITDSKVLESISNPESKGVGEIFEYSIKQRWELF